MTKREVRGSVYVQKGNRKNTAEVQKWKRRFYLDTEKQTSKYT